MLEPLPSRTNTTAIPCLRRCLLLPFYHLKLDRTLFFSFVLVLLRVSSSLLMAARRSFSGLASPHSTTVPLSGNLKLNCVRPHNAPTQCPYSAHSPPTETPWSINILVWPLLKLFIQVSPICPILKSEVCAGFASKVVVVQSVKRSQASLLDPVWCCLCQNHAPTSELAQPVVSKKLWIRQVEMDQEEGQFLLSILGTWKP